MAANPTKSAKSAGARYERAAWLSFARRLLKTYPGRTQFPETAKIALEKIVNYGETRQKRYEKRPGGLGRK